MNVGPNIPPFLFGYHPKDPEGKQKDTRRPPGNAFENRKRMTPACLPSSRTNAFVNDETDSDKTENRNSRHGRAERKRMSISILKEFRVMKLNKELNIELNRELNKMQLKGVLEGGGRGRPPAIFLKF